MTTSYLRGRAWTSWSREERLFCAVLYEHARRNPSDFARWIGEETGIPTQKEDGWDLGFEVCFYRDYLWQLGRSARAEDYSPKRTFDLCLFGEQSIVILEAKVFEAFQTTQLANFAEDAQALRDLLGQPDLQVWMVALASSTYFVNVEKYGSPDTLGIFHGRLTWQQIAARYPDPILGQVDYMYKLQPGAPLR